MLDVPMTYSPAIPNWFDVRKAARVAAFFAKMEGGVINILKLVKLIYLADRESMDQRDHPITGDDLRAMKFGPMNSVTLDCLNGGAAGKMADWQAFIAARAENDISLAGLIDLEDLDELSRSDLRILQGTWDRFKDVNQWELAQWTHDFCPEWSDPGNSSREITYAEIFRHLGKRDPDELAAEVLALRNLPPKSLS